MPRLQRLFVAFLLAFSLSSCKSESHVEPSFYYWKTRYDLTQKDSSALADLKVKRLYVRFFDIDIEWDENPQPIGRLENVNPFPAGMEIVPVIFITNKTLVPSKDWYNEVADGMIYPIDSVLSKADSTYVQRLAENLVRKTHRMASRHSNVPIREIQLDCDWSANSRLRYFYLVSEVKRLSPDLAVSVTIRLHQYKYPENTGVPPADRGMLMYYNMSRIQDTATRNYILDNDEGEKYLTGAKKYPLPLDFALPIHSQGTVFTKYKYDQPEQYRFVGLLSAEQFTFLQELGGHLLPTGGSKFIATQSHNFSGNDRLWLQPGSLIRYDEVSNEALTRAAKHIAPLANAESYHVVFFHLDSLNLNKHSSETLAGIVNLFN